FWAADERQYRLTRWSHDGKVLESYRRTPSWFRKPSQSLLGTPRSPPEPAITAVSEDAEGLIWTFVRVAAPTWRSAWPSAAGEFEYRQIAMEKLFRTMVEVLDLGSKRVVARQMLSDWVIAALPDRRTAVYAVNDAGVPRIDILQLTLLGR
ncbi:MAG: hypothetical protein ACT4R6_09465, partial [Gemmatimonadaceae bacterium]